MELSFPDHPFWDFSIRTYSKAGVAEACLALQERHDADVNVLLYCLWIAGRRDGRLTRARLAGLLERTAPWRDRVVLPLRELRDLLKAWTPPPSGDHAELVRATVKRAELDAEHAEQLFLADGVPVEGDRDAPSEAAAMDAAENLAQYLSLLRARPSAEERAWAATLLSAAYPDVPADKIAVLSRFGT